MRPIPASNDASRGICDENRPVPQQRACFSSQVLDYPIPLNDCSLALPPLSEYGEGERRKGERKGAGMGAECGTQSTEVMGSRREQRGRRRNDGSAARAAGARRLAGQLAAPRKAHPPLLGGFAGEFSPKDYETPTFSQVDDDGAESRPRNRS